MKQQGWLSKIVPQPKEATVPCLHGARRGPWGGGFRGGGANSYDEISMPSKFHFNRFGANP